MKKMVKDGWHEICGYDVYVEDGKILRGLTADKQRAVYPFRAVKTGGYDNCVGLTVDAFRAGVRRGTIIMR